MKCPMPKKYSSLSSNFCQCEYRHGAHFLTDGAPDAIDPSLALGFLWVFTSALFARGPCILDSACKYLLQSTLH